MANSKPNLLPCPFCGELEPRIDGEGRLVFLRCAACGAGFSGLASDVYDGLTKCGMDLAAKWNNRMPYMSSAVAATTSLRDALRDASPLKTHVPCQSTCENRTDANSKYSTPRRRPGFPPWPNKPATYVPNVAGDHGLNIPAFDVPQVEKMMCSYGEKVAEGYEETLADHRRLVRELDVLLNGEGGAAKQASLCDIVSQVRHEGIRSPRGGM